MSHELASWAENWWKLVEGYTTTVAEYLEILVDKYGMLSHYLKNLGKHKEISEILDAFSMRRKSNRPVKKR